MTEKFKFTVGKQDSITEDNLLSDLRRVAEVSKDNKVTQKIYSELGEYNCSTVIRKFGKWNVALKKANLQVSNQLNIPDEKLFNNILKLWEHLGKQPRRIDLENKVSEYSQYPYNRRFGSWNNALENFVSWANNENLNAPEHIAIQENKRKTGRDPSIRLRYLVMKRDNYSCKQCGASPAKDPSIELHIDHIFPWSKGGETTFENLQTLCSKCNLGKSNLS